MLKNLQLAIERSRYIVANPKKYTATKYPTGLVDRATFFLIENDPDFAL